MEITLLNFEDEYGNICNNLKQARFVGFDAEFSAILAGENRLFDTNQERYDQLKTNANQMIMIQIGLTMFKYDRDINTYVATGYTFHLCPQMFGDINQSFIFQASTLKFFCRHNFDFHKFIYNGLPYLSKEEEEKVRGELEANTFYNTLTRALEMNEEKLIQHNCSVVSKWLTDGEEDTLYLDVDTPVLRYIMHNEIRLRFPTVLTTNSLGNSKKVLIYRNGNVEGATYLTMEMLNRNILNDLLGFSKIISLLEEHKKPIVGHNIFLDVLLLHNQFIGPLPNKYSVFKENIHKVFPELYDTKYISHQMAKILSFDDVWKSNALQDLFEFFKENKCKKLISGSSLVQLSIPFNVNQTYHEAGWDSYCAGYCFIRLGHWAACQNSGGFRPVAPSEALAALEPYCNKVNVIRGAVPYMNLVGEDPKSHRPGLLYVRAVKEQVINIGKVATLLASCGSVDVKPYGSRAALVAAGTHFTVDKILKQFRDSQEYRFSRYSVYKHSAVSRVTMWSSAILSGSLVLYLIHKKIHS